MIAILQLCISFSLIFWYLFQPFIGEYFELRSRLLIYEYVMGTNEIVKARAEQESMVKEHRSRFKQLSEKDKENILNDYRLIQQYAQRPTLKKLEDGLNAILFAIPPFEMAWIVFSAAIAISLLKKSEGAKAAAWLIPLIALSSICDITLSHSQSYQAPDTSLFPSEDLLIGQFVDLSFDALEGEFNFTIARLKSYHGEPISKWIKRYNHKMEIFPASLMLLWSLVLCLGLESQRSMRYLNRK